MRKQFNLSPLLALLASPLINAQLFINEVDADTQGTDTAEFIELYNSSNSAIDLNEHILILLNGKNNQDYRQVDLSGHSIETNSFLVICGNKESVENCDIDKLPATNALQNGADAVALYSSSFSSSNLSNNLIDILVYDTNDSDDPELLALLNSDQPQINEDINDKASTQSNQRCGGEALNSNTYLQATPTPGKQNLCNSFGDCGTNDQDNFNLISEIQGDGYETSISILDKIIVEAIVTHTESGLDTEGLNYFEFWLQEEDDNSDNNPLTSEGIFVYGYDNSLDLQVADKVRLEARVGDYNQQTQLGDISNILKCSSGNTLPSAASITLPITDKLELESLEGMRVSSDQTLLVSDLFGAGYGMGNFGQFVLSSALHYQPTEVALPNSPEALNIIKKRNLDILFIDDGDKNYYPEIIPFPTNNFSEGTFSEENSLRIGNSVTSFTGIMNQMTVEFSKEMKTNYTIIPTDITFDTSTNARTLTPSIDPSANLIIAGMNVLNLFNGNGSSSNDIIIPNDINDRCFEVQKDPIENSHLKNQHGFPTDRGACTYQAYQMQLRKIVSALKSIDADIIGLMEIENDGFDSNSSIQHLVEALNNELAVADHYAFINPNTEKIGHDAISVGILYRPAKISLIGDTILLTSDNSPISNGHPLFIDQRNRPSLIQSFEYQNTQFTISVNHLKSKGSACEEPNEGVDGQGNCNIVRTNAADALVQFLESYPTGIETDKIMILGDLNAYSQENPMQKFYQGGYKNLKYTDKSTEENPYSFSFSGFLGSLDHALVTDNLLSHVVSVDAWHINSVEDPLIDYATEANGHKYLSIDNYAAPDAYRSSDHDPIIIGIHIPSTNQPPQQLQAIPSIDIIQENQVINVDLSVYFTDLNGDSLTFTSEQATNGLSLNIDGVLSGKINQPLIDSLPLEINISVSDGEYSLESTINIINKISNSSTDENENNTTDPDDNTTNSDNNSTEDNTSDNENNNLIEPDNSKSGEDFNNNSINKQTNNSSEDDRIKPSTGGAINWYVLLLLPAFIRFRNIRVI